MEFWAEIVGQADAVRALEHASSVGGASDLSHAWLITGPPGSGRSNLAFRFAAALIAQRPELREQVYGQVVARTHPDLGVVTSQKVQIGIDEVRGIVQSAHYSPSQGRHRVIVIEDADRMPERTSNVLLKALEEPPERTIWILCAPSEADLLPTIRSRVRSVRLVTPAPEQIAGLLHERDGVPVELAERAARLAQSHIGMARRLATDTEAMARRERTIEIALDIVTLSDAMRAAATLAKVAADDAAALAEQVDTREREEVLRGLGVAPGAAVPAALRSQVRQLEELQKRRATRQLRDGIDRILTDLLSLHRDVLLTSLDAGQPLVNAEVAGRVAERAERVPVALTLDVISAIEHARERIARNVTPQFVLEALFATQISGAVRSAREGVA
ncbi:MULTISPECIES: DNA polymerase III subunit delta' [unclassified Leucobacter]|uniref:DNA polymerase III subunit delta' n=1 Tax=unclassified Leucobacter TaxID=2621730 RepID=UPI00165E9C84|nr:MULTISPECIES: DNA polymerase III subunit delta' [unclassified Leucobacter]MBC9927967.1 DNA polymerase III subunit delta' [Leucobacter sp. cx-169]